MSTNNTEPIVRLEPSPSKKRNTKLVLKDGKKHARIWEIHYPETGNTVQHHKILSTGAVMHGSSAEAMKTQYERKDCYEFRPLENEKNESQQH